MVDRRPITVVVPVYGDAESLLACLRSLIATVDTERDGVLIVNDCGPDADAIERDVLALVSERPGFRYERNPRNLGFVGTCNRAALELVESGDDVLLLNSDTVTTPGWLDELGGVLHDDPSHGIVCARSTNATIASLPLRLRDPQRQRTLERTLDVATALRDRLPRYSYPPVAMGFCFLVRRELIDRYGLFDEAFAPGYGEENDFCLRMATKGFRSVMAHRAIVAHEGARSFTNARRARLRAAHERILAARHPDYSQSVREYLWCSIDPVDAFADALATEARDAGSSDTAFGDGRPFVLAVLPGRPQTVVADALSAVTRDHQLTILTMPAIARAWRAAVSSAEVLVFGGEEGRVWDIALNDSLAGSEAALRAAHAAPRVSTFAVLETAHPNGGLRELATSNVDDQHLRQAWRRNALWMQSNEIPRTLRPSTRSRALSAAERFSPTIARAVRTVLRR